MPCSSGFCDTSGVYDNYAQDFAKRLDEVTDLLCTTLYYLEQCDKQVLDYILNCYPEVAKWWKNHKEIDRKRLKKEKAEQLRDKKKKTTLKNLV